MVDIMQEWKLTNIENTKEANTIYNEREKLLETKLHQLVKYLLSSKQKFKDLKKSTINIVFHNKTNK